MFSLLLAISLVGSIQHESLFPTTDISDDRTEPRAEWAKIDHLSNTYADLGLRYSREAKTAAGLTGIAADTRFELLQWPLLGFEEGFAGHGIGRLSIEAQFGWGSLTAGDVYGQFGSGFILNLYEQRSLGVDNSLRGGKIDLRPVDGFGLTLLGGKQRRYWNMYDDGAWGWNYKKDAVLGADLNLDLGEWIKQLKDEDGHLTIGASWVSKYEQEDTTIVDHFEVENECLVPYVYNVPKWVGATDARVQLQMKGWSAMVEYAYKANDPSIYNDYSYDPGHALMASLSYSQSGLSVIVQAKRTENMYFSSVRRGNNDFQTKAAYGYLNLLPAFAYQHTYALAAVYPYATQMDGEWAMQGEVSYLFKRGTKMGGKYGTRLKLNASHIRGLGDTFFQSGEQYYTDVNLELNKKISKRWTLNAMLMYQAYNALVIEGEGGTYRNGIAVVDAKFAMTKKIQMRAELQYMYSKQGGGQRIFGLYELSLNLPKDNGLMLTAQEQYVIGHSTTTDLAINEQGKSYYQITAAWQHKEHRLTLGFIKTREGWNCSGGVCRLVPKQEGIDITYHYTF